MNRPMFRRLLIQVISHFVPGATLFFSHAIFAQVQTCELYPIAVSAQTLSGKINGDIIDVFQGTQQGNFGWLTWTGNPSVTKLEKSLTPSGDSATYVNPDNTSDKQINVGDWIQGKPGVSNSENIRDALNGLKAQDIIIPVWNETRGQGEKAAYRVSNFARIRITDYTLPNQNRISAIFLGYVHCDNQNQAPVVDAGGDQTITLPASLQLQGYAIDDGLPAESILTTAWAKVSGPGAVIFEDIHMTNTVASFSLDGIYVLRLTASDSQLSTSNEITVTVIHANQPPVANLQEVISEEDIALNITLTGSDPENDTLTYIISTPPSHGILSGVAPNIVYTPVTNYNGNDSFTFKIADGQIESDATNVLITVLSVNDRPVADSQSLIDNEDTEIQITLTGSDIEDTAIQFAILTQPHNGVLTGIPPNLTYIPDTNYHGLDSFIFKASDGQLDSEPAVVSITVDAKNDPPVAYAGADQIINFSKPASLSGSVSDIETQTDQLVSVWTKVSGEGDVSFEDSSSPTTSASVGTAGIYILRLTVSDGEFSVEDEISIAVNNGPLVYAGEDQTNFLGTGKLLEGFVIDDGLPSDALEILWSVVDGPGLVMFEDRGRTNTLVNFSKAGDYILRLTGSDSVLTNSDDVTITVLTPNQPPLVFAGQNQLVTLPNGSQLNGFVSDDQLPAGNALSLSWSVISGPGEVTFDNQDSTNSFAHFGSAGIYVLRLTATDMELSSSAEVTIVVRNQAVNGQPHVDAGIDKIVGLTNSLTLNGNVLDDGLPLGGALTISWIKTAGPGTVTFENPANPATRATFSERGTYVLRLIANDSEFTASDEVSITVYPHNNPPSVDAGIDQTVILPLVSNGQTNLFLSRSLLSAATWNNEIGIPGLTGPQGSSLVLVGRNGLSVEGTNLYAAGSFSNAGGILVDGLGKWNGINWSGLYDPSPINTNNPASPPIGHIRYDSVLNIAARGNELFVSGGFLKDLGQDGFNDFTARWDGTGWKKWQFKTYGAFISSRVMVATSNKVYFAGNFLFQPTNFTTSTVSLPVHYNLAVWDGTNWGTFGEGIRDIRDTGPPSSMFNYASVFAMAIGKTGEVYAAGSFTMSTPTGLANNIAKWNGSAWEPMGNGITGCTEFSCSPRVYALAMADDGILYAGGDFTTAGEVAASHVAKWNGNNWAALGEGLNNGVNNRVEAIATIGNDIYVAGAFLKAGVFNVNGIAKWNGEFWYPLGTGSKNGIGGSPLAAAACSDGIYFGGNFTLAGGTAAANIAKWQINPPPPGAISLFGRITDDGIPANSFLSSDWSKVSGPGTVLFENSTFPLTSVTVAEPGIYTLRLAASDSDLTGQDDVTINVIANEPPTVEAKADAVVGLGETATLIGTVVDDGLPAEGLLLYAWSAIAGPGTVTFGNPSILSTTAKFSVKGVYLLRLTANDSHFNSYKEVFVTVIDANSPPVVTMNSSSQTVAPGKSANLIGTVTDDGYPTGGVLTVVWTKTSGPGTVYFSDANAKITTATFSAPGSYNLRLTANDSQLSAFALTTITVQDKLVNAGVDQTNTVLSTVLKGAVTAGGFVGSGTMNISWSRVSGPTGGIATFSNSNSPVTGVTFNRQGDYTLRLTASDVLSTVTDDVIIRVPERLLMSAGPDRSVTLPTTNVTLFGWATLSSNLFSSPGVLANWSKLSGPGTVSFGTNFSTNTFPTVITARFSTVGTYVLRLEAHGTTAPSQSDTVTVVVAPAGNSSPVADSGPDLNLSLSANTVTINGLATDDALPDGILLSTFEQIRGPASAIFSNTNTTTPTVTFPVTGIYVLRLNVTDGVLTNGDEVIITVTPPDNAPPLVEAGSELTVGVKETVMLNGDVVDDGLPANVPLIIDWRRISGPGRVVFSSTNTAITTVTFDLPGVYILKLTATEFLSASDQITITVVDIETNLPPFVNAGLDHIATSFGPALLSGAVTDDFLPQDSALVASWSQITAPSGGRAFFADANSPNTTVKFYITGTYVLRLTASDSQFTTFDDLTVIVVSPTNSAPFVDAGPDMNVTRPNKLQLLGTVLDDSLPVAQPVITTWSKVSGPGTVAFSPNANDYLASATFSMPGTYVLQLSANDSQFITSDDISVIVREGTNQPPSVNAGVDFLANTTDFWPLHGTVSDDGLPGGNLQISWDQVSGTGTAHFSTVNGIYYATFSGEGDYVLRLTATDFASTNTDNVAVSVYNAANPPAVAIVSPIDSAILTAPTSVTGTVASVILEKYELRYRFKQPEGVPPMPWTVFATGNSPVSGNALGVFDPTLLLNGIYEIQLAATDILGRTGSTEPITIVVDRNLKIGNFAISFNDLTVPVAGIPIQVTRTYDSRDKRMGDFGVGWTLDLKNIRLQKNRPLGRNWEETFTGNPFDLSLAYHLNPGKARIVTIAFPGGQVQKFRFDPNPLNQGLLPIDYPRWRFTPLENTRGTLEPAFIDYPDGQFLIAIGSIPGPVNLYDFNYLIDHLLAPEADLNRYPTLFRYSTPEGYRYLIDEIEGLKSVTDPNGNTLLIGTNGLTWTNTVAGTNNLSVAFKRDSLGRITNIVDTAGSAMTYHYDTNGNLSAFVDRASQTNRFAYDGLHNLITLQDARGITPVQNQYDPSGRLVANIDAFGNTISYGHDLVNHREYITNRLGHVTISEYDQQGNVIRMIDPIGAVTLSSYDENGNLLSTVDPLGRTNSYTYDSFDNRLTATDPLGNTTRFTYGAQRRVTSVTDPRGSSTTNVFDANGNVLISRDSGGNTTLFTYSSAGLPVSITDARGNILTNRYDSKGQLTNTVTLSQQFTLLSSASYSYDGNGNPLQQSLLRTSAAGGFEVLTMQIEYDALNRPVRIVQPDGTTNQTIYNMIGKPAVVIDQMGRQSWHVYDDMGRVLRTTNTDGTTVATSFDAEGKVLTTTDRRGFVTTNHYDAVGRLVSTDLPNGTSNTTYYNLAGQLIVTTDARGNNSFYGYDAAGRNTAVTNALGQVTTYGYDANGNRTSITDALGRVTTYSYNYRNLLTNVAFADGTIQTIAYDAFGRRISQTDQAGKTTRYGYDSLGRMVAVTNALGHVTSYEYNEVGNQTAQVDANLHRTTYEYDPMGRRTKRTLPGCQAETYLYDATGNMTARIDFNGRTTAYFYDDMNRLTEKRPDARLGQPSISFTYTLSGQRQTMSDASGVTTYTYDVLDRLANKSTPQGALAYTYDVNGNLASLRSLNSNGTSVTYEWDALNRLAAVNDAQLGRSAFNYDPVGNLQSYTYPNLLTTFHEYDALNHLTNHTANRLLTQIAGYAYTLGAAGNRLSVLELTGRSTAYTYDNTYRLLTETVAGAPASGVVSYVYDPVGNRLSRNSTLPGVPFAASGFDVNDRLASDQYDANGNTLFAQQGQGVFASDQYDFEDHLISRDNGAVQIVYDGDGNRVRKTIPTATNTVTTSYLVDDLNPSGYTQVIEELTSSGVQSSASVVSRVYTWGHMLVSQDRFDGVAWQPRFYGYDGSGNVRYLTDLNGQITDSYDFDANGVLIGVSGNTPNNYRYRGQQYDFDLGLYYLRARYHNPNTGRFWNQDTFEGLNEDPQSLHKYTYAHNNPVNLSDPSGNFSMTEQLHVVVMAPTVRAMVQRMFMGAMFGGTISGLDAAISGKPTEDVWKAIGAGAGMGAAFGALPCGVWSSSIGKALSLFFVAHGIEGSVEAFENEEYVLGVFRAFATIIPLTSSQLAKVLGFCFTGDTKIATEHGLVPIKDVKVGNRVWSWNEQTGEIELREVTALFSREAIELVIIKAGDNVIEATPEHPFKVGGHWKRAGDLIINDELVNREGWPIRIDSLDRKRGLFVVYNFEVEESHTYLVGRKFILVHNGCGPSSYVRKFLPPLSKGYTKAFEGPPRLRTFKAGEKAYRSPRPGEKTTDPGNWFGTRETTTQSGTDSMYQITKYGNPNNSIRTYEFKRDATVYYGKVKGGTGYQMLFPDDVNPGDVLGFLGEGPLQ